MKKLLSILLITSFSLIGYAQTRTFNTKVKINEYSTPTVNDSIATINAEGEIGLIPKSSIVSPSLQSGNLVSVASGSVNLGGTAIGNATIDLAGNTLNIGSDGVESLVISEDEIRISRSDIFVNTDGTFNVNSIGLGLESEELTAYAENAIEMETDGLLSFTGNSVALFSGNSGIAMNGGSQNYLFPNSSRSAWRYSAGLSDVNVDDPMSIVHRKYVEENFEKKSTTGVWKGLSFFGNIEAVDATSRSRYRITGNEIEIDIYNLIVTGTTAPTFAISFQIQSEDVPLFSNAQTYVPAILANANTFNFEESSGFLLQKPGGVGVSLGGIFRPSNTGQLVMVDKKVTINK